MFDLNEDVSNLYMIYRKNIAKTSYMKNNFQK